MRRPVTTLALVLPLLLILAVPAVAGPPWISIEYPVNPHDPETRGALLVVRTYHHDTAIPSRVVARAIGAPDGRRVARSLEVVPTSTEGVYAVRGTLSPDAEWVVAVTRENAEGGASATALVALRGDGEVLAVRVPSRVQDGWTVPVEPGPDEVDELLRTAVAMSDAARSAHRSLGAGAALVLLLLIPAGAGIARRRRSTAG
jgi:hypothetical protein